MSLSFSKKEYANANKLQQDHPCVIELIRRQYLHEPAPPNTPLNLKYPKHKNPSAAQSQAILRLLGNLVTSCDFNKQLISLIA